MHTEIERKYLVKGDFKTFAVEQYEIEQGFLSTVPERVVRIRLIDDEAFITVKGKSSADGTQRLEWEQSIGVNDAKALLKLCEPYPIQKTRYIVPVSDELKFEIDVFHGKNKGLIIAEIELSSSDVAFEKPQWLGKEVTGDVKYYNSNLAKCPFTLW